MQTKGRGKRGVIIFPYLIVALHLKTHNDMPFIANAGDMVKWVAPIANKNIDKFHLTTLDDMYIIMYVHEYPSARLGFAFKRLCIDALLAPTPLPSPQTLC